MIAGHRCIRWACRLGIAAALVFVAGAPSLAPDDAGTRAFGGDWRPLSLRACALSLGYVLGGLLSMPVNPLAGATVASFGLHAAVVFCS